MFGATGTFMYNGLKLPYFLFFGRNNCSAGNLGESG
jgi:multicomponent Na+:H+ antiporter subunit D